MICRYCGNEVNDNAAICMKCGCATNDHRELSLWSYFVSALSRLTDFEGRARRREYWGYMLFSGIFLFILGILIMVPMIMPAASVGKEPEFLTEGTSAYWTFTIFTTLIMHGLGAAVCIRRLHDVGKSGVLYVIGAIIGMFAMFVPFVNILSFGWGIYIFALSVSAGNVGENQYGDDPKN